MDNREDMIMMRPEELKRFQIIGKVLDGSLNQQEAAELVGLSDRQVRRIVKRVRCDGERGIPHGSRGRRGNHRIADTVKTLILDLYRERYKGFGPLLASEKLLELDKIRIHDETLRLWLIADGQWKPHLQKKLKNRSWRPRKERFGEMAQMDGSHHAWLEDRGPKLVLMGMIDDATGNFHGKFFDYEGTKPAMGELKAYAREYGLPQQLYLDKHSTYRVNSKKKRCANWSFADDDERTQFGRASKELGIELIFANSPQAKGRIERVFRTLQNRLVKEMRLRGIKTCEEANEFLKEYLPKFNARFAVKPLYPEDLHRPVHASVQIDEILSVQTKHVLRNDRTVIHDRKLYQVLDKTRAKRVVVFEYLNGRMAMKHQGSRLSFKAIDQKPAPLPRSPRKIKRRYWKHGDNGRVWGKTLRLEGSAPFKN
jgi:ribosomal protein L21